MLKTVTYYLLLLTTTARLIDIMYILTRNNTNLPMPVIVVTVAMVAYGTFLLVKKQFGSVPLRQFMFFYMTQTVMIAFNLCYVALKCPLRIGFFETLIVGTFLDIIVNCGIIYACAKQIRSHYFSVATSNRHV